MLSKLESCVAEAGAGEEFFEIENEDMEKNERSCYCRPC